MSDGEDTLLELDADHGPTFDRDAESAAAGGIACTLHGSHSPTHLTVEYHHLIPVAWQLFYEPPLPWPNGGIDPEGRGQLWDARTIPCCPTGHRNVHYLIVAMMHVEAGNDVAARADAIKSTIAAAKGKTLAAAMLGLERFTEAGGALTALAAARKWGEA